MRILIYILFSISFLSCQTVKTNELKAKASKIHDELLNNKSLPSSINVHSGIKFLPRKHTFDYSTTRKDNKTVYSVNINITVIDDSLKRLSFDELYFNNGNKAKEYDYKINQYHLSDHIGYNSMPEDSSGVVYNADSTVGALVGGQHVIYYFDDEEVTDKKEARKFKAIYYRKLTATINELCKMLFH